MKRFFLLLILSVFSLSALAQDFTEEEGNLIRQAYEYSDSGREDESIAILDELIEKHPDLSFLKYEKAYCLSHKQDYKNAYETLKPAMSAPDVVPEIFASAGQCLDMMGKPGDALKTFRTGLERFPHSGCLHEEIGNILIAQGFTKEGLYAYECGIDVDPTYPSNYYHAAQLLSADYPVKAIIYAETHNLRSNFNDPRWVELSKLLYDTYNDNIHFEADTVRTTFARDRDFAIDTKAVNSPAALLEPLKALAAAEQEIDFDEAMKASIDVEALKAAGGQLTLAELTAIRRRFLENFDSKKQEKYDIPAYLVFDFQKKILDAGHWEAYNMFTLREGSPEEFKAWQPDHDPDMIAFLKFMTGEE